MSDAPDSPERSRKRMGRPPVYPQGRRILSLSLTVDEAEKLRRMGTTLFVKEAVTALPATDEDRGEQPHLVAFRLTDAEFERLEAKGGVEWIKKLLI